MSPFKFLSCCALVLALGALGAGRASACDACGGVPSVCAPVCYKTVTCYKTCTVYETRVQPYTHVTTCVDACGAVCEVRKTCYRTVKVPVTRTIAVKKVVPVSPLVTVSCSY